ncbi:MAG: hypothetical protein L6W00_03520 [Lentisphaeria bacterium]|nr:MAG: hypothetical protein L6W00_03520 [Lentisphaeria bacterium]
MRIERRFSAGKLHGVQFRQCFGRAAGTEGGEYSIIRPSSCASFSVAAARRRSIGGSERSERMRLSMTVKSAFSRKRRPVSTSKSTSARL